MQKVICFGEVLWDLLPMGKLAGGAPMNVAFHLNQLGVEAKMISRIGNDELGKELLDFFQQKNISTELIQKDESQPTGIVKVMLDEKGSPSYEIVQPVAWDFIADQNQLNKETAESDITVFVFGSLAARSTVSRKTLFQLLEKAQLKILDVNLRAPFYNKELLDTLLQKADIVKMNDEELELIGNWFCPNQQSAREKMMGLKEKFQLRKIIVTRGANGAVLLGGANQWCEHSGFSVSVKDTIGSGDAFLAAFISQLLTFNKMEKCLEYACAMGAFVATRQGGTPAFSKSELETYFQKTIA